MVRQTMSDSIVFLFMSHKLSKELVNQFCEDTPFLAGEVQRLWRRFQALDSAGGGDGALTLAELIQVKELLYNPFTPRIVELFSGDGSGRLDFQQFLHMMSVFSSRASAEAKVVWAFALWDFDGDDLIGPRDIKKGLRMLINTYSRELRESAEDLEQQADADAEAVADHPRDSRADDANALSEDQIQEVLRRIGEEIDPEGAGLTFSDFEGLAGRMPGFVNNFRMSV